MHTETTPLLSLLQQRWEEFVKDIPDPTWERPTKRPQKVAGLYEAARAHAEADLSDPFSYGRALHYMRQGYLIPSEVVKQARALVGARKAQGVTFAVAGDDRA